MYRPAFCCTISLFKDFFLSLVKFHINNLLAAVLILRVIAYIGKLHNYLMEIQSYISLMICQVSSQILLSEWANNMGTGLA